MDLISIGRNMMQQFDEKFKNYSGIHRGIDVDLLLKDIEKVEQNYLKIEQTNIFDWNCIPKI